MTARLTKLKIAEVSSVDHGAGEGARVLIAKHAAPLEQAMRALKQSCAEIIADVEDEDEALDATRIVSSRLRPTSPNYSTPRRLTPPRGLYAAACRRRRRSTKHRKEKR